MLMGGSEQKDVERIIDGKFPLKTGRKGIQYSDGLITPIPLTLGRGKEG